MSDKLPITSLLYDKIRFFLNMKTWQKKKKENCDASTLLYSPTGDLSPTESISRDKVKILQPDVAPLIKMSVLY